MRFAFLLLLVGCSSAPIVPADDASLDGSTNGDATFGFDVTGDESAIDASCVPHPCPASLPTSGSSCSGDYECEYGSAALSWCGTRALCTGTQWQILPAPDGGSCAQRPECPATIDDALDAGPACGSSDFACHYLEGTCGCAGGAWKCIRPTGAACAERPRVGTACSGGSCAYGQFCTSLIADMLVCTCGTWQEADPPECPP